MTKMLIATGNRHKTEEIRTMLGEGYDVEDLRDHPHLPSPEETGTTFEENATIKALAASAALKGVMILSDDSGLEVDALGGAPGVTSARYAGPNATDKDNRDRLKREFAAIPAEAHLTGRFRCCMVLAKDEQVLGVFDGAVEGTLLREEEGAGGFGYDPLFVPDGHDHSFGVLSAEIKNSLSHRSRALQKVVEWLKTHTTD